MLNNYPLIIKEYAGENRLQLIEGKEKIKKNVYKLNNDQDFNQEYLKDQDLKNYFIQEFSDTGEDYRIFVKLGKVIAGWKRKAVNGFMTVNGKNSIYEMYNEPNEEIKAIAEKTAKVLEADFMAVDFMYIHNKPQIQEISLHPGYKAYETKIEGTPVNIAEAIITAFPD
jgi:glutathione synthase/RimK-type ligase-like ATP-grasp enzyme